MENSFDVLKESGNLYSVLASFKKEKIKQMGVFKNVLIFWKLLIFKKYNLKKKLEVVLKREDKDGFFLEYLNRPMYSIFGDLYKKKLINYYKLTGKETNEKIRCLFSVCNEVFIRRDYPIEEYYKGGSILDIGANVGIFTFYANHFFPQSKIFCFEPERNNFNTLVKNLESNKNIQFFNFGIGAINSEKELRISKNVLCHSIADKKTDMKLNISFYAKQKVKIKKIDSLELGKVGLIKIDIEGYEEQALLGAKETISKFKPKMFIAIEHSKKQKDRVIKIVKSIEPKYKFKPVTNDVLYFYCPN